MRVAGRGIGAAGCCSGRVVMTMETARSIIIIIIIIEP